jgi:hypothetical protein
MAHKFNRLTRRGRPPSAAPANTETPVLSGVPRQDEYLSIGAGEWDITPDLYRFRTYRDGVLVNSSSQTVEEYHFLLGSSDVDTTITATVEASANSGTAWSSPVDCLISYTFETEKITPNYIPTPSMTRTSASGVIPMTFTMTGALRPSYLLQIRVTASDLATEKYIGFMAVSAGMLQSPFTLDLSGDTDPAPQPPMSALLATDVLSIRIVSADYLQGTTDAGQGVASDWMSLSPTDRTGYRYWKLVITSGGSFLREIEAALAAAGANVLRDRAYTFGDSPPFARTNNFNPYNYFDHYDLHNNVGALTNKTVTIDMGVNADLHELRMTNWVAGSANSPSDFTWSHSNDGSSFTADVTQTGVTWATDNLTKTYTW